MSAEARTVSAGPLTPGASSLQDAQGRLPLRWKAALTVEVMSTYVRARRLMREQELPAVVEALRSVEDAAAETRADELLNWQIGERLGAVVARTLRPLPADTRCLMQSLVLTRMMARRGIPTTLIIGVRTEDGFSAHAWVERGGLPLLPPGSDYGRLVEL